MKLSEFQSIKLSKHLILETIKDIIKFYDSNDIKVEELWIAEDIWFNIRDFLSPDVVEKLEIFGIKINFGTSTSYCENAREFDVMTQADIIMKNNILQSKCRPCFIEKITGKWSDSINFFNINEDSEWPHILRSVGLKSGPENDYKLIYENL
jgi:hypothetical protein